MIETSWTVDSVIILYAMVAGRMHASSNCQHTQRFMGGVKTACGVAGTLQNQMVKPSIYNLWLNHQTAWNTCPMASTIMALAVTSQAYYRLVVADLRKGFETTE